MFKIYMSINTNLIQFSAQFYSINNSYKYTRYIGYPKYSTISQSSNIHDSRYDF